MHVFLSSAHCFKIIFFSKDLSQGAGKSHLPEVGIEPGAQDLKANTLPRRCKSRLLPQGSRSVLYTYIPTTYFPSLIRFVPESTRNHVVIPGHFLLSDARNTSRGPHILATKCHRVQKIPNRPRWESNPGRRIKRQTLYHVAVKAGFYRKAVEVYDIPIPTTKSPNCPRWESNLGRRIYHVAVKAGFYRKAVEVYDIPFPTTYFPALIRPRI